MSKTSNVTVVMSPHIYAESAPFIKVGEHKYLVELTFNKTFAHGDAFSKLSPKLFIMSLANANDVKLDLAVDYPNYGQTIIACNSPHKAISTLKAFGYDKLAKADSVADCFELLVYRVYNRPEHKLLSMTKSLYFYKATSSNKAGAGNTDELLQDIVSQERAIFKAQGRLNELLSLRDILNSKGVPDIHCP